MTDLTPLPRIDYCPKCGAAADYDPAQGGFVTAKPCGHSLTLDEAAAYFPDRFARILGELS